MLTRWQTTGAKYSRTLGFHGLRRCAASAVTVFCSVQSWYEVLDPSSPVQSLKAVGLPSNSELPSDFSTAEKANENWKYRTWLIIGNEHACFATTISIWLHWTSLRDADMHAHSHRTLTLSNPRRMYKYPSKQSIRQWIVMKVLTAYKTKNLLVDRQTRYCRVDAEKKHSLTQWTEACFALFPSRFS